MKKFLSFMMMLSVIFYSAQDSMFSPYDGYSSQPITVSIDAEGMIYYTTNGDEPTTSSASGVNHIEVPITEKTTFKAFYVRNGNTSEIEKMTYYIGEFYCPKLFFKPPQSWTNSCVFPMITEPRSMVDFLWSIPMDNACEGWKKYAAPFAIGNVIFDNCGFSPETIIQTPAIFVDADIFYDFSEGNITTPPDCLLSVSENSHSAVMVKVFPNPASDILKFQSEKKFSNYEIMDFSGKIIEKGNLPSNEINVSKLASGSYFIQLLENGREKSTFIKFIKK